MKRSILVAACLVFVAGVLVNLAVNNYWMYAQDRRQAELDKSACDDTICFGRIHIYQQYLRDFTSYLSFGLASLSAAVAIFVARRNDIE